MDFIEFKITSDFLYLGERPKGDIFKPCIKTIPFTQITGALNRKFESIHFKAVGYLSGNFDFNETDYLSYSPRDRISGTSKIPLQVEFLCNVQGKVYVLKNEAVKILPDQFEISMGGLRSKGFGRCFLSREREMDGRQVQPGVLKIRIPMEETSSFNIREVKKPVYGYLFKPIPKTFTGNYVLSLFEGSEVVAPKFLTELKEKHHG